MANKTKETGIKDEAAKELKDANAEAAKKELEDANAEATKKVLAPGSKYGNAQAAKKELVTFHRLILSESVKEYKGERSDSGLYHGRGEAFMHNGDQFTGNFEEGLMHGKGRYEWADGTVYNGDWFMSKIQGKGKYRWGNGSWYEGEVSDRMRHGQGVFCQPDLERYALYEGSFKHGSRHGKGILYYMEDNSSYYDGEWKDGMRHGEGKIVYISGNIYSGTWVKGRKCGHGKMEWKAIEQVYEGEWKDDLPHGDGEYCWGGTAGIQVQNGIRGPQLTQFQVQNRYKGRFKDGMRHGEGSFYYASGEVYRGGWRQNVREGTGRLVDDTGKVQDGEYKNGRRYFEPMIHPSEADGEVIEIVPSSKEKSPSKDKSKSKDGSPSKQPKESKESSPTKEGHEQKASVKIQFNGSESIAGGSPTSHRSASTSKQLSRMTSAAPTGRSHGTQLPSTQDSRFRPHVEDLLQGYPEPSVELDTIMNILQTHNSTIRCIYRYYSAIEPCDKSSCVMMQHQLWRLIEDCELRSTDLTFAEVDRYVMTAKRMTAIDGEKVEVHKPDQNILIREFIEVLVRIAHKIHVDSDEAVSLSKAVSSLLSAYIFKHAARFAPQVPSLVVSGGHVGSRALLKKLMAIQGRTKPKRSKGAEGELSENPDSTLITPSMSRVISRNGSRAGSKMASRQASRQGSARGKGEDLEALTESLGGTAANSVYGEEVDNVPDPINPLQSAGMSGRMQTPGMSGRMQPPGMSGRKTKVTGRKKKKTPRVKSVLRTGRTAKERRNVEREKETKNQWLSQNEKPPSIYRCAEVVRAVSTYTKDLRELYESRIVQRPILMESAGRHLIDETISWGDLLGILLQQGWVFEDAKALSITDYYSIATDLSPQHKTKQKSESAAESKEKTRELESKEKESEEKESEENSQAVDGKEDVKKEDEKTEDEKEEGGEGDTNAEVNTKKKERPKPEQSSETKASLIEVMGSEIVLGEAAKIMAMCALRYQGDLGPTCKTFETSELKECDTFLASENPKIPPSTDPDLMERQEQSGLASDKKKVDIKERAAKVVRAFMHKLVTGEIAQEEESLSTDAENVRLLYS